MKNIELVLQELVDVNLSPIEAQQVQHIIQHAFMAGKAEQADPLAGYSNLTDAIKSKQPIDWEKLKGLKVQCVNPDVGEMRGELKRYRHHATNIPSGWWTTGSDEAYVNALVAAWNGKRGWSLYVEGDIPLIRKTADQLKVGTYFLGQVKGDSPYLAYVGRPLATDTEKTIYYAPEMLKAIATAADWVVLEEYGPFQKPDVK